MLKRTFLSALLWLVPSLSFAITPEQQRLVAETTAHFNEQINRLNIPGGAMAIVWRDQLLALHAVGVRREGQSDAVNGDTVFRLASVSKTFAGNILVQLAQEQKLDLQTPITEFVPGLVLKTPQLQQQLTVEQVLGQRTGYWSHAFEDLLEADQTPEQIKPRIQELNPVCPVGQCYSYQNVLFGFLTNAAEQTSGLRYDELLQQKIFRPLGMQTASVGLASLLATANRAWPHQRGGRGWRSMQPKANFYRVPTAAGVNASARDLAHYLQAMLGTQPQVFRPELLQALQQPQVRVPNRPRWPIWQQFSDVSAWYGLGWRVVQYDDQKLFYHAGVVDGYRPYIAYSPSTGYGIVLLTNAEVDIAGTVAADFWQSVLGDPTKTAMQRRQADQQKKRRVRRAR